MEISTTLIVLCSVIVSHGAQGQWTTAEPWRPDDPTGTSAPCGGYLTASKGQFNSPNYPSNYPNNAYCTWNIQTTPGSQIVQLEFPYVNLEGDFNCRYDSISVYDGYSTYNRLLGKLCGGQSSTFYSTGSSITVQFTSDSSSTYKGFQAEYRVVDGGSCRHNCGYQVGNCSCSYSCEYRGNCCQDYQQICYDTTAEPGTTDAGPTTRAQPSCRYNCGYNLGSCSCSSSCQYYGNCCYDYNEICYDTTTDSFSTAADPAPATTGVSGTHPTCGGNLHGSGSISSPYYPEYYHDNAYCVWLLSAPSGQRIFLSFTDLELENCCSCDYISVYDGSSVHSQMLGTICDFNNSSLAAYHSTSNYMTVLFRSDQSVVSRGFRAMFSSSLASNQGRVDCSSDNMNIVIQRSYLISLGYDGNNLYLNDQHCRPQVNSFQVVFSFPINTCGTQRKFENGRVKYINGVRAYRSDSGEITRQSHFLLHVECRMEQDTMVQVMYETDDEGNGTITGTGRFNSTMAFFTNSNFYSEITQTPYKITLNQNMYVQVRLRRSDSSLHLFLDTCVASPSPHDFQTRSYDLVRNGCRRDPTYYSYTSGTSSYARFTFQAFKFLRAHESVYLQCKVTICQASDYNSRCRRGCRTRKARDLGSSQESHTLILGPIQLKDLEKPDEKVAEKEEIQAKVEP
ncbi:deleted in malignant brain tumors 1 protein isoform X4 [Salmo trutta]|uniref:deleted in malignant brain tumors 1 protein isoform X4 n=1 Tax=Salmo trutta TaxID=8032 RepID=UPI0011311A69|nr:deleted in malignant brain tumors 1 protein-like isoform X4 [Salmo trutta]